MSLTVAAKPAASSTAAPASSTTSTVTSTEPGPFPVTFLDSRGDTVKVEWVKYGGCATAPTGYGTYSGYWNVTASMDLHSAGTTSSSSGFIIPNTGVK